MICKIFFLMEIAVAFCAVVGAGCGTPDKDMPGIAAGDGGGDKADSGMTATGPKLVPSAMANDLVAAGLDIKHLPPIKSLDKAALRMVMQTFARSMGTDCSGCHVKGNFETPTANKNVAAWMWDNFTTGLAFRDGQPFYCDSCHAGKMTFLNRADDKTLAHWMQTTFVDKLQRLDGSQQRCESCHGDPFVPNFLKTWQQAQPN